MGPARVGRIAIELPELLGGDRHAMAHIFSPSAARSGWPRATRNITLLPAA